MASRKCLFACRMTDAIFLQGLRSLHVASFGAESATLVSHAQLTAAQASTAEQVSAAQMSAAQVSLWQH